MKTNSTENGLLHQLEEVSKYLTEVLEMDLSKLSDDERAEMDKLLNEMNGKLKQMEDWAKEAK